MCGAEAGRPRREFGAVPDLRMVARAGVAVARVDVAILGARLTPPFDLMALVADTGGRFAPYAIVAVRGRSAFPAHWMVY